MSTFRLNLFFDSVLADTDSSAGGLPLGTCSQTIAGTVKEERVKKINNV